MGAWSREEDQWRTIQGHQEYTGGAGPPSRRSTSQTLAPPHPRKETLYPPSRLSPRPLLSALHPHTPRAPPRPPTAPGVPRQQLTGFQGPLFLERHPSNKQVVFCVWQLSLRITLASAFLP